MKSLFVLFLLLFGQQLFGSSVCNISCSTFVSAVRFGCNTEIQQYKFSVESYRLEDIYTMCAQNIIPNLIKNDLAFNRLIAAKSNQNTECPRGAGVTRQGYFGIKINSVNCNDGTNTEEIEMRPVFLEDEDMVRDCKLANLNGEIRFGFKCHTSNKKVFSYYSGTWITANNRQWTQSTIAKSMSEAALYCRGKGRRLPTQKEWEAYQKSDQIDEILAPGGRSVWTIEEEPKKSEARISQKSESGPEKNKLVTCVPLGRL